MIQFFRQNNFFTTLMLIPYTFIVRMACFYLYQAPEKMKTAGVLYSLFLESFEDRVLLSLIVINFIIAFTAILVNRIVIKHRLSRYQTLLPGLFYIIIVSWLEVFLNFSAIHIANFFVMIGLLSVFKFDSKHTRSIVILDGGFYFALSALFYTPYVIYILPAFLGFISLYSFKMREFTNLIVGFALPYFVVIGFLYYLGVDFNIFDGYEVNRSIFTWFSDLSLIDIIPLFVYGAIIITAIFFYARMRSKKTLQVQKKINILYWFLLTSFFTIFFINERNTTNLLILAMPLSIIVGIVIEWIKAPYVEEFVHVVILGGVLYLHFNNAVNILM